MKAETLLDAYFSADGPGVAVGLISNGRQPEIYCSGLADIEAGIRITPSTRFELASASKMITATVIMQLYEQGKIDLHEPVGPLIGVSCSNKNARPVTVRDLLQHTSSLPDYLEYGGFTPPEKLKNSYIAGQLPSWFDRAVPGRTFNYSNTNYVILAQIVETIIGDPYDRHLRTLLEPLNMENTGSVIHPDKQALKLAIGYSNHGYGSPQIERCPDSNIDTQGDGGLFSCVTDLLIWQQAFWEEKIIGGGTIALMSQSGRTDDGDSFPYGLGLQVETTTAEERWIGHGGSWMNSTILVGHYPDKDMSVAILSNEAMAPVERLSQRAFKLLQEPDYERL